MNNEKQLLGEDPIVSAVNDSVGASLKLIEKLGSGTTLKLDKAMLQESIEAWDSIYNGPSTINEMSRIDLFVGAATCLKEYVYLQEYLKKAQQTNVKTDLETLGADKAKIHEVNSVADLINAIENETFDIESFKCKFLRLGNLLQRLSICILTIEGIALPKYLMKKMKENQIAISLAEKNQRKRSSEVAIDAKYSKSRVFKDQAATVAKQQWEQGSTLTHDKMVKFLTEEYEDSSGKHPFTTLPDKKKSPPENVLREVLKGVAKEMNRPELIRGNKKMK